VLVLFLTAIWFIFLVRFTSNELLIYNISLQFRQYLLQPTFTGRNRGGGRTLLERKKRCKLDVVTGASTVIDIQLDEESAVLGKCFLVNCRV
jgi:hypothetical protein